MLNINIFFLLCITDFIIALVGSYPIDETNLELIAGYFEGDMILSPQQEKMLQTDNKNTRKVRHVLYNENYRWPNRTVLYHLSKEFSNRELILLHQAMEHISQSTCIRFEPVSLIMQSTTLSFVMIRPSLESCSSQVGFRNNGIQYINLKPMRPRSIGCFRFGTIVHEILHTLGIFHQHSAYNRDHYVRIYEENIKPGKESNFRKLPKGSVSSFGINYDYASVMHYGRYAFSSNGMPTIEPIYGEGDIIGQREGLSTQDILKIRHMYEC